MYWYRMEQSLGRYPLVGTTVRRAEDLPKHLVADENPGAWLKGRCCHHGWHGMRCADVAHSAYGSALTEAYGVFKAEAQAVLPTYKPKTVCLDAWKAGQNAWKSLFNGVFLITCF